MADEVMADYHHVIDSFTFITGSKGAFEFKVDGNLLYSKKANGRHANPGEIQHLFREFIGTETPVYPKK